MLVTPAAFSPGFLTRQRPQLLPAAVPTLPATPSEPADALSRQAPPLKVAVPDWPALYKGLKTRPFYNLHARLINRDICLSDLEKFDSTVINAPGPYGWRALHIAALRGRFAGAKHCAPVARFPCRQTTSAGLRRTMLRSTGK